jgi:hypothetical protein
MQKRPKLKQKSVLVTKGDVSLRVYAPYAKMGEVPTFQASDTNTDLPIVSTNLFNGLQYLKNCFIASK